jgi:hypothetical protein
MTYWVSAIYPGYCMEIIDKSKSEIADHVLSLVSKMTYTDSYITRQCEEWLWKSEERDTAFDKGEKWTLNGKQWGAIVILLGGKHV